MSAEPLTREERERRQTLAGNAERWLIGGLAGLIDRYEATVRAAEERAEDWMRRGLAAVERAEKAEEQAEALRVFLGVVETCSNDTWLVREATELLAARGDA